MTKVIPNIMSGSSLILFLLLMTVFQLTWSSKSKCTDKFNNCSCSEINPNIYTIDCFYEDHSSIKVNVVRDRDQCKAIIKCKNILNWSNFHSNFSMDHLTEIEYENCSPPKKSEDSRRVANLIGTQGITKIIYTNLNGSLYSHNFEVYPNLTYLDLSENDIRNSSFDFLKGNVLFIEY